MRGEKIQSHGSVNAYKRIMYIFCRRSRLKALPRAYKEIERNYCRMFNLPAFSKLGSEYRVKMKYSGKAVCSFCREENLCRIFRWKSQDLHPITRVKIAVRELKLVLTVFEKLSFRGGIFRDGFPGDRSTF